MTSDHPLDNPQAEPQNEPKIRLSYLLAYDGSPHAQAAIDLILELPHEGDFSSGSCAITLFSVLPTQAIGPHEQLQEALGIEEQRLREAGYEAHSILKAGNPAATINDYAQETRVDLIVMGAKGRRATLGILLGGVAQQVVEYSSRPVLIVRAPFKGLKKILVVVDGSGSSRRP